MARPKRKEREIEQTRIHIAFSAASLFAEQGFGNTTMQQIAEAAGYSAPSLYKYFEGKDQIVEYVVEVLEAELADLMTMVFPKSLTFAQRLEIFLQQTADWIFTRKSAYAFLVQGQESGPQAHADVIRQTTAWIEANSTLEERNGTDSLTASIALNGLSNAFFSIWFVDGGAEPPDYIQKLVHLYFNGLGTPE